ncbi:MAG: type I methionyl aminopeptidase [Patescibacteria group bacterium]
MITIKTKKEIDILREGGKRLAGILLKVRKAVRPGVTSLSLDLLAEKLIREAGDEPAFLRYQPWGAQYPYPASLCVSVNNEVVHGIPRTTKLKDGDIVSLDLGIRHEGLITDAAVTVAVGHADANAEKLIRITQEALGIGILEVKPGNFVGDIGKAIEKFVKPYGYGVVKLLGGHGVGYEVHEEPFIPNYKIKGNGPKLKTGMVLAIEPMLNEGTDDVYLDKDGYTFKTADGKRSAHFEHTVVVTDKGAEILTTL